MATCPTCGAERKTVWCSRCGTLRDTAPALVLRCREYVRGDTPGPSSAWVRFGVAECLNKGDRVRDLFEQHEEERDRFSRILIPDRKSTRPGMCAMLYLSGRFGGKGRGIDAADADGSELDARTDQLTETDVIYLLRCGVQYAGPDSLYLGDIA